MVKTRKGPRPLDEADPQLHISRHQSIAHTMKPRDILKLAVRLLGLVFLYNGLQALPTAVIQFFVAVPNMNLGNVLPILVMSGCPPQSHRADSRVTASGGR
jgi:hypothetical protein